MTQRQLADAVGTLPEVVSRMENGVHAPSLERLDEIARALGIAPRDLLDFEGEPREEHSDADARLAAIVRRLTPNQIALLTDIAEAIEKQGS